MKKLLALLMALMLVFSLVLVSCDESDDNDDKKQEEVLEKLNGKTPEELYKQMSEELSLAKNMTMVADQDIDMTMIYQGQEMPMKTKQTVTQKIDGDNFSMVTENNMAAGVTCYYVDGMVYNVQITDGSKIKYKATIEELNEKVGVSAEEPKLLNLPESWFKDVKFKADETGERYYIELVLDGNAYEVLFSNMTALQGVKEVSDVTHKVYFTKDGKKIDSVVSTATMVMEMQGMEVNASFVSTSTYSNIGTTVVEAPADADSYRLVDISQLG
ncbi:MAG: hypothetical protein E7678_00835 [Ruminococcaceae bacterium]|nr:hypothetical protein [Oscillospiraceae bacterium]